MSEQIGFVGIGNQGGPMALRIARAGLPLQVWARRPETLSDHLAAGATAAGSLAGLAAACDLVGVCVTADADVRTVVLGDDGLLPGMRPGSSLAVHSTIHPDLVREVAATAAACGVAVLDAPVSGGNAGAAAGRLAVLVGGEPEVLERWRPVLATYASSIELLGPVGSGQLAKLVNNALSASNLAASLRAVQAAAELGLDPEAALRIMQASSGDSFMLRAAPAVQAHGPALAALRYRKDVDLFHTLTQGTGTPSGAALWATADAATAHMETLVPASS